MCCASSETKLAARLQRLPFRSGERADHADAPCAAAGKLLARLDDGLLLAPAHINATREHARLGQMIVVLDKHCHRLAGTENRQRLVRARPAGHPARRVAHVLRRDDQQVVDVFALHHAREGGMAAPIFAIGKPRVILLEDDPQLRRKVERIATREPVRR
jgi:hypothetical protein